MSTVVIRPARPLDAGRLAGILAEANAGLDWLPQIFTAAEEIRMIGDMTDAGWIRVAFVADSPAGFIARKGTEIHGLALRPQFEGQGVGRALMRDAQRNAAKLGLWSYLANDRATRFYDKAGFIEMGRTDGAGNEAGMPDIRFEWHREQG
jgi:ribosomal protein S18 acetylase RimI-like enzyme